jgi:acetylornithine/succinyldiaminopimelate/putrescine aminotransferase
LWAHESFGVMPDLMTLAKPLAGGLPIGAVLMTEPVAETIRPGCHGTTFGGGPFVATVARHVLGAIADRDFLDGVRASGERLRDRLASLSSPAVHEVRGAGLLLGVRVDRSAHVRAAAFEERLLLAPAGDDVLRFVPRLDVTDEELDEAVARFERALARVEDTA